MKLKWECLDSDYAFRTPAPLFGSIRVQRHNTDRPWRVTYSVPGYSDRLINGKFDTAVDAMREAEQHIALALAEYTT